ncbi:MAG: sugar ABC transporter substrate-binding protein [bacterium]|nr:sugar ABC transporter substrate-binding protein [bacterium]
MNSGSSKILAIMMVIALLAAMLHFSLSGSLSIQDGKLIREDSLTAREQIQDTEKDKTGPLILWYTDESLTDYLMSISLAYQGYSGTKVSPVLVSGVEYLEQINAASINDQDAPDLYITSNDNLMKAYLAGLATKIEDPDKVVIPQNYPQTALHAVGCDGELVAYPFYYETNFFLYNKTFMADLAKQTIETEADQAAAEEAMAALEAEGEPTTQAKEITTPETQDQADGAADDTAEDTTVDTAADSGEEAGSDETGMDEESYGLSAEVLQQMSTMIPSTIDDILAFADNYDAPETVEYVFKWDVSDIFYNYFFVGNYIDVGGEDGDNNANFNIFNQETIDCLQVYQDLNQFFSIDTKEVTYDKILQEFIEGKTVFTVATTDAIAKIEEAKAAGNFSYEYGVAVLPDLSSKLKARGLSVTNAVAINGYSGRKEDANAFAEYLTYTDLDTLYNRSGKIACRYDVEYDNPEISNTMLEYQKSVSLPKMIEASNFWVQLEIAFTKVWTGSDPEEELRALSELIGSQIDEIGYTIPTQESISAGADEAVK